ncbi:MAG: OmpA family protein, partial [Pseudomonadota bacterium]
ADIVVVREPISAVDASRFANAYGVNMRSRYAERVVAIAASGKQSVDCGISYQQNDMVMSTEDDPSSERVYLYVNPAIPGTMRDQFIDFALTGEGQKVVARHAVDLRLQVSDAGYAAWRYRAAGEQEAEIYDVLERFRRLIRTSQRVSSTFRFDFASADLVLDARSEQDLENLIDLVKTRDIDSRRILLFGFADSSGDADFNVGLSRNRADAVAIRLRLAGIPVPPRNVHGIGEDSPVACNLQLDGERDETGAQKNRRVEVWIES